MIHNSVHIFHIYQQYDHLFSKTVKSLKKDAKDLGVSGFGNKHQLAWRIAKTSQFKDVFGWSGGKCPNRDCRGSLKLDLNYSSSRQEFIMNPPDYCLQYVCIGNGYPKFDK